MAKRVTKETIERNAAEPSIYVCKSKANFRVEFEWIERFPRMLIRSS